MLDRTRHSLAVEDSQENFLARELRESGGASWLTSSFEVATELLIVLLLTIL